eukprot:COSAG06_NODE_860_length_11903_cov_3.097170_7_plen_68_part_00
MRPVETLRQARGCRAVGRSANAVGSYLTPPGTAQPAGYGRPTAVKRQLVRVGPVQEQQTQQAQQAQQ